VRHPVQSFQGFYPILPGFTYSLSVTRNVLVFLRHKTKFENLDLFIVHQVDSIHYSIVDNFCKYLVRLETLSAALVQRHLNYC
jgi:hypothetical protein